MNLSDTAQKEIFTLIVDPKVLAIAIHDNQDPMLDLKTQKEIAYGPSPEIPNNTDYTKLRTTVYEKLKQAQALLPEGYRFCIYEAYRSLQLQKTLFDNRYNKIKKLYPDWSEKQIFAETIKLISPVINEDGSVNIPAHSTGGAIDIYLMKDGHVIDMGIHPKDWQEDFDGKISATLSPHISAEATQNRKIMSNALEKVGFVNYPTEFWHWSYGDRYWAFNKKAECAIYGTLK